MSLLKPFQRLVMIGACYVDTILSTPHFPGEDQKLRAASVTRRRGGNCANSLEVLQQLPIQRKDDSSGSLDLVLISVLPSEVSEATRFIKKSFGPLVDLSHCIYREAHTEPASSYIIRSQATGSRTIVNYNGLPEMTVEEFVTAVSGMDGSVPTLYHFEGRETATATRCIEWLRQHRPEHQISVELEKPGREGLRDMADLADVILFSRSWAEHEQFDNGASCLSREWADTDRNDEPDLKYPRIGICTWGDQGAAVKLRNSVDVHEIPAITFPGRPVIDTVGAGDAFIAAFFFGLWDSHLNRSDLSKFEIDDGPWRQLLQSSEKTQIQSHTLEEITKFAILVSGFKVTHEGFSNLGSSLKLFCATHSGSGHLSQSTESCISNSLED